MNIKMWIDVCLLGEMWTWNFIRFFEMLNVDDEYKDDYFGDYKFMNWWWLFGCMDVSTW